MARARVTLLSLHFSICKKEIIKVPTSKNWLRVKYYVVSEVKHLVAGRGSVSISSLALLVLECSLLGMRVPTAILEDLPAPFCRLHVIVSKSHLPFQLSLEPKPCQWYICPGNTLEPLLLVFYPIPHLTDLSKETYYLIYPNGRTSCTIPCLHKISSFLCKLVSHPACTFPSKPWDKLEIRAAILSMAGKTTALGRQRGPVPIGWLGAAPMRSAWLVILSSSGEEGKTGKSRPLHRREVEFREAKFHFSGPLCCEFHIMIRVKTLYKKKLPGGQEDGPTGLCLGPWVIHHM